MKTITVTVSDEMAASLLAVSEVFEREPGAMLEEVAGFVFEQMHSEHFADEFGWINYDTREQAERVGRKAVEYSREHDFPLFGFGVDESEGVFSVRLFDRHFHAEVWDWSQRVGEDFVSACELATVRIGQAVRSAGPGQEIPFNLAWVTCDVMPNVVPFPAAGGRTAQ